MADKDKELDLTKPSKKLAKPAKQQPKTENSSKSALAEKPAVQAEKKPDLKVVKNDTEKKETKSAAYVFPETVETETYGKLASCKGKFLTVDEVKKAIYTDKKKLFIGGRWTKKLIREKNYAETFDVPKTLMKELYPEGFPNDLDILQVIHVCTYGDFYAMSTLTESIYRFKEEDLPYDDESKTRWSAGLEFEIYEKA